MLTRKIQYDLEPNEEALPRVFKSQTDAWNQHVTSVFLSTTYDRPRQFNIHVSFTCGPRIEYKIQNFVY